MGERENTETRILDAVGTILSRKGFRYLGVNGIAREAGVDKVLIYRYFGGLQPLLRTYFTRRKYWPSTEEILETAGEKDADPATRAYAILRGYLRELKKSDAAREVLRGEIAGREDVAVETAEERYRQGMELLDLLREPGKEIEGLTEMAALLSAGFTFLLLRRDVSSRYLGLDLRKDETWERLERAIHLLVRLFFAGKTPSEDERGLSGNEEGTISPSRESPPGPCRTGADRQECGS